MDDIKNTSELEDFAVKHVYWIRVMLKSIFCWPYSSYKVNLMAAVLIYVNLIIVIISTVFYCYQEIKNPVETDSVLLAEMLFQITTEVATILHHISATYYNQKLKVCLETGFYIYRIEKNEVEKNMWLKLINISYRLGLLGFCFVFALFIGFLYTPVILNFVLYNKKTPLLHAKFFNDDDAYYGYIFMYETVVLIYITNFIGSYLSAFIFYSSLILLKVRRTSKNIRNLKPHSKNCFNCELSDSIENKLIESIKIHQNCLKLFDAADIFCRPMLFIVLIVILICFTSMGFIMVVQVKKGLLMGALKMVVGCIGCIIILSCVCFPSQLLIDVGNDIQFACYSCSWDAWAPKTRLILLMIMMRTSKSFSWIAGPGIILNFETVAFIVKTGLSYIMTMISLYS